MGDSLGKVPAYQLYELMWTAVDWVFPPKCGGCQKPGTRWCGDCQENTLRINPTHCCPVCGDPNPHARLCNNCRNHPPGYQALRSWGQYVNPLREAIHTLKYRGDMGLADSLSRHLIGMLMQFNWNYDLVTAVPLSENRLKERGFNQSALLARPVALYFRKPFQASAIQRVKETKTQVGLTREERRANVTGAFLANQSLVSGKSILVVDDVATTGATMHECTRALLEAGAREIFALTLARAGQFEHT